MTMIRLNHNVVQSVSLVVSQEEDKSDSSFQYEKHFSEDDKKSFAITFKLKMKTPDCDLDIVYASFFLSDEEISEEDHDSKFYKVNAPAIGYPFLRAYVANLLMSSGFNAVMIPTINFVNLAEEKNKSLEKNTTSD